MPEPIKSEGKVERPSVVRLRWAGRIFFWAGNIGICVLLYFVSLLIAAHFVKLSRASWMICFASSLLALSGHLVGWLFLIYRSKGYGISGFLIVWQYWLLALVSTVSVSFAFSGFQRYFVLFGLVSGIWLSSQIVPMLLVGPVMAIRRFLKSNH
jgi:hypothetical protein